MRHLRTKKTVRDSSSSDKAITVRLSCPTAWAELSQKQLRYVLTLMSEGYEDTALKTYIFIRFAGIKVMSRSREGWKCVHNGTVFHLRRWQVAECISKLKFVDSYENMSVRLDDIQGFHAVDELLERVPFFNYLKMEIAYQAYIKTKDTVKLARLARLLYCDDRGKPAESIKPDKAELLGCYLWFAHIKSVFADMFPDFFRRLQPDRDNIPENYDIRATTDAQLRILTDGDITKEESVRNVYCQRALTELNAKAREARILKSRKP